MCLHERVYVDDILVLGKLEDCTAFEKELEGKVTKIKAGEALRFTGIEIQRNREARTVTLTQGPYITGMVEAEGLLGAKPKSSPASSLLNYATLERGTEDPLERGTDNRQGEIRSGPLQTGGTVCGLPAIVDSQCTWISAPQGRKEANEVLCRIS